MKKSCFAALLLGLTGLATARAQTMSWRPFRPGLIYSYQAATAPGSLHTLRVDSSYATPGGDSVYAFNRVMRPALTPPNTPSPARARSRNNLFGARLRWTPGSRDFYLETLAEPLTGAPAQSLLLRPAAAVGSSWAASAQPTLTATLSQRGLGPVAGGGTDSLATIVLSNGQQLVLSRRAGLVQGPAWLTLSSATAETWQQGAAPQPGLGLYAPTSLFNLNVGDELGYSVFNYVFASGGNFVCAQGPLLRRITGRRLTADSLVLTFREQRQQTLSGFPGCGPAGTTTGPVLSGRWAFSLRTGQSPQLPGLALLTDEFRLWSLGALLVGSRVAPAPASGCLSSPQTLTVYPMYPTAAQSGLYFRGLDDAAWTYQYSATLGLGPTVEGSSPNFEHQLTYFRRGSTTCGTPALFAGLLPTRAALAAQVATLHPNPATEQATLTLAAPLPPGEATLTLTDALGRPVWRRPVAAGQTQLPVPLAGLAPGLYLVQLQQAGAGVLTWKLIAD